MEHGAYPSPLNYGGFPKSICSSVNEVVIHGIPDDRKLEVRHLFIREGDKWQAACRVEASPSLPPPFVIKS